MSFIDFKAAFDTVHRESLWCIVRSFGIPQKIVNITKNMYSGSSCCVRVEGQRTDFFQIKSGVRQGCVWSPLVFSILNDWILKQSLDKPNVGLTLTPRRSSRYPADMLSDLDFADDITLLDDDEQGLQASTSRVNTYGAQVGLNINKSKTKVMPVASSLITSVSLDGEQLSIVSNFQYLGSYISGNGTVEKEINVIRIGKAGAAYKDLDNIWKQQKFSLR